VEGIAIVEDMIANPEAKAALERLENGQTAGYVQAPARWLLMTIGDKTSRESFT
jgi:hypothetical protein